MSFWGRLDAFGNSPCIEGEMTLTYSDVARLADGIFSTVTSEKNKKALALIVCGRDVATLLGYLGCLRSGVTPIHLPEDMSYGGIADYISRYKPQYLWCKKALYSEFLADEKTVLYSLFDYVLVDFRAEDWGAKGYEIDDQLALLLTTSGTTTDPKLVRLSYDNLQANADSISQCLEIRSESKPITLLPFNYSFGLSVINSHLNCGSSIVFSNEGLTSRGFWDVFKTLGVTSFYGVPYHYEILKRFRFSRLDFPSLSMMAQAGGRMPDSLKDEFYVLSKAKGYRFICMYGQTEATARISYLPPSKYELKSTSVGIAIPGGVLSIRNPDKDNVGEVHYQGSNVSLGYANGIQDLSENDLNHGELDTGDFGYLDADGYLFLTGRKKRYIKVFGNSVNLDHVEKIACELSAMAAVIGRDDEIKVLVADGKTEDVRAKLLSMTTIHPKALSVVDIDGLIYKSSGKIDYGELGKRYLAHD